jgi:hypothetical protein
MTSVIMTAAAIAMAASKKIGQSALGGLGRGGSWVGMVATIAALVLHVSGRPSCAPAFPIALDSSQTVGAAAEKTRECS